MKDAERIGDEVDAILEIASVPHILDIVCRTTGMRFAAVARVTGERWITCAALDELGFGLGPGDELAVQTTLCHEVRACRQVVVIDDVETDPVYRHHHTPAQYGFRSYISMPIVRKDGTFFGTLCAIDPVPRRLNEPGTLALFGSFAELISRQLDDQAVLAESRSALGEARRAAALREEFIAVLGHDLRNPLASISSGLRLLRREPLGARAAEIAGLMQSSVERMDRLIDNLLDLARGRLGGGIPVEAAPCDTLMDEIEQVIAEHATATGHEIVASIELDGPVLCDRQRIGQLLSNLIGNALTYGDPEAPVRVEAQRGAGALRLSVVNRGEPIPEGVAASLFEPFFRGGNAPSGQGLGLGLYIAAEIAKAHRGTLTADSSGGETRFTLTIPLG